MIISIVAEIRKQWIIGVANQIHGAAFGCRKSNRMRSLYFLFHFLNFQLSINTLVTMTNYIALGLNSLEIARVMIENIALSLIWTWYSITERIFVQNSFQLLVKRFTSDCVGCKIVFTIQVPREILLHFIFIHTSFHQKKFSAVVVWCRNFGWWLLNPVEKQSFVILQKVLSTLCILRNNNNKKKQRKTKGNFIIICIK